MKIAPLVLSFLIGTQAHAALSLHVKNRLELSNPSHEAIYKTIGEKRVLASVRQIGDVAWRIEAHDVDSKASLGSVLLPSPGFIGPYWWNITSVFLNSRGETLVGAATLSSGVQRGLSILANLSTGQTFTAWSDLEHPQFMDAKTIGGRTLVAVSASEQRTPGDTRPPAIHLKLIDADSLNLVAATQVSVYGSGEILEDSKGRAVLLWAGYEAFLHIDPATGAKTPLLPEREQPSLFPRGFKLANGQEVIQVDLASEKRKSILIDKKALADKSVNIVASLPTSAELTQFKGRDIVKLNERARDGAQPELRDLLTGRPLELGIPRREPVTSIDLIETDSGELVALSNQTLRPNSFRPGTRLELIDTRSGNILMKVEQENSLLRTRVLGGGTLKPRLLVSGENFWALYDAKTGRVLSREERPKELIHSAAVRPDGRAIGLNIVPGQQVCVVDLEHPRTDRACVVDPLVDGTIAYGYKPVELKADHLRLPLLVPGANRMHNKGLIEFEIR